MAFVNKKRVPQSPRSKTNAKTGRTLVPRLHRLKKSHSSNYSLRSYQSLLNLARETRDVEVIKWLVRYGARVDRDFVRYIVTPPNCFYVQEILSNMYLHHCTDVKLVQEIFLKLVKSSCRGKLALDFLKLLLDHNFPVDDYIDDSCDYYQDGYTPLQLCITYGITDFVLLLLKRGANIHKKTSKGATCLWLAIYHKDSAILEVLLRHGARVDERVWAPNGPTALHEACELGENSEIINTLLEYGADVNALCANKQTPLMIAIRVDVEADVEVLVKQLARLSYEKRPFCSRNLNSIKRKRLLKNMFDNCLQELERMSGHVVYQNLTLYDVLRMRHKRRKLSTLTKNNSFVQAFESSWNSESFEYFGKDLGDIFEEAKARRDALRRDEKHFYSVLKYHLPLLVIYKVAYLANEELFF